MKSNAKAVKATKDSEVKTFNSITECAKELGVSLASVSICLKKNWKVRGWSLERA